MFLQLFRDAVVGQIVFAGDHDACSVPVDPVNNARTENAVDPGETSSAVMHECVDQCSFFMSGCGMDNETLRLIDEDHVIIFIEDVQRDLLRQDLCVFRLRDLRLDQLSLQKTPAASGGSPSD